MMNKHTSLYLYDALKRIKVQLSLAGPSERIKLLAIKEFLEGEVGRLE